jgi:hypothetical protein
LARTFLYVAVALGISWRKRMVLRLLFTEKQWEYRNQRVTEASVTPRLRLKEPQPAP